MLDPSISLAVKPPVIASPVDAVTKAISLRDMMQQQQLRAAQTQEYQAQAQQRQMDLQDQQTFQKGMQDPATQAKVAKGDFSDFEGKMQEKNLDPLRTSRATYLQNLTRQNTEDLTNSKTALSSVASAINGLKVFRNGDGTLDLNKVNDALPGTLATLTPSLKALKFDSSQLPKTITDESQLDALGGHIGATLEMHNQAIAMQEAQKKLEEQTDKARREKTEADKAAALLPSDITSGQQGAVKATQDALQATAKTPVVQAESAATLADKDLLTPEQRQQVNQYEQNLKVSRGHLAVSQQEASLAAKKFQMEFGGDAVQGWAKNVLSNPDTASQVPAALRTPVEQELQKQGYSFPKPADANSRSTEVANSNALANASWLEQQSQNPLIKDQLGPILGRLQKAEQTVGTSVGLSPEAAKLAQEFRTRARYFVFQEAKGILGGRLPQTLVKQLEDSSADVRMDPNLLAGALQGAKDAATTNLDSVDAQRFGGTPRPRTLRGLQPLKVLTDPKTNHSIATDDGKSWYDAQTGAKIQ